MKKILFVLLCALSISLTAGVQQKDKKKSNKETVVLDVEMNCDKCQRKIEKNIPYEKGITALKVDLENDKVEVEFRKDKTSVEKLLNAFDKLGFVASLSVAKDSVMPEMKLAE